MTSACRIAGRVPRIPARAAGGGAWIRGVWIVGMLLCLPGCRERQPEPIAEGPTPWTDTIIFVTVDALNDRFIGDFDGWSVTPTLDGLLDESVVLPDTFSTRGLTRVALASLHTGLYPRHTGIRNNEDEALEAGPDLFAILHDAGWQTFGMSTNQCTVMDFYPDAVDTRVCYSSVETPEYTQPQGDELAITALLHALEDRDPDRPVFARLHVSAPHWPYTPVEPWLHEFYPDPWTEEWDPAVPAALVAKMLSPDPITDAERTYLHAVYASQVRGVDEQLAELFDGLRELGLYDRALIVFGSDHGDELAMRTNFIYHGCSVYDTVLGATYSFKVPGLAPGRIDAPVSIVNVTPTILELAGVRPPGDRDGVSMLDSLTTLSDPGLPVYFERSPDAAAVVEGSRKLILSPTGDFDSCAPYNSADDAVYPNAAIEIYDRAADPDERTNLADAATAEDDAMHDRLCTWVTEELWDHSPHEDDENPLVVQCRQRLGIPTEPIDTSGGGETGARETGER